MDVSGEYRFTLSRKQIWTSLLDSDVLCRCLPGCEEFEQTGDEAYVAKVRTTIGPVKATFTSELKITNAVPYESYRIEGDARAGPVGFGRGFSDVTLDEKGGETILRYTVEFQVGGKLAQLGSRLVVGATRKVAEEFFARLAGDIAGSSKVD